MRKICCCSFPSAQQAAHASQCADHRMGMPSSRQVMRLSTSAATASGYSVCSCPSARPLQHEQTHKRGRAVP